MAKNVTAEVCMKLSVVVHVGNWEGGSSFDGLYEQALREAQALVATRLKGSIRLIDPNVGEMTVTIKER